jgi:hypothetical protein
MKRFGRKKLRFGLLAIIASLFAVLMPGFNLSQKTVNLFTPAPAVAQYAVRPQDAAAQIYQRFSEIPQENNYINKQTGEVDTSNTLIERLIRYHLYVKSRPPVFRLDWKLTFADYLGANELMDKAIYPGYENLQDNPMDRDREIISSLSRTQRNELVQALVEIYNPNYTQFEKPATPQAPPTPAAQPTPRQPRITLPQAGDANLLK